VTVLPTEGTRVEFDWTDEQTDLRSGLQRLLRERAPIASARALGESGGRHDPATWRAFADAGLTSLALPENYGGAGASPVELAIVGEELGRVLHGGPFLSTAVLAAYALLATEDDDACSTYLPAIAGGELTAALAVAEDGGAWRESGVTTEAAQRDGEHRLTGHKPLVLDGHDADLLLVGARDGAGVSLYAVEATAPGITRTALATLDLTRPMAALTFAATPARLIGKAGGGWDAVESALRTAWIFIAAEQAGGSAQAVEVTAEYARTRRQFGRDIGAFQGVKHRLADMAVRAELSRSAAYWAAWQEPGSPEAVMGAHVAAAYCGDSYLQTAKDMIQLHGGIGFTWEHDAHLYLRRARADAGLLGGPSAHRSQLEAYLRTEATR
jgi:alkylation response protein AidB-like acyl-CoA dehydrogenase